MRRRFLWYCGFLATATAFAQPQEPEPLPIDLSWQGPETCNGSSQTLAEIRQMLPRGRPLANPSRIGVAVEAHALDDGKWAIRVATLSGDMAGERQLKADSCEEARRAVALLVALMLDPQANIDGSAPPKTKSEPGETWVPPTPTAIEPRESPPRAKPSAAATWPPHADASRKPLQTAVGAHLVADDGTLPAIDVGARLIFGLRAHSWELGLRASGWASRNKDFSGAPGMGVSLGLYDAELAGCGIMVRQGQGSLELCGGPRMYAFRATSYGVSSPGSVTEVAWGVFGELAFVYRMAPGAVLRLGLEALVPFQRPKFAISDLGLIYQPRRFAERISLGPEFEF